MHRLLAVPLGIGLAVALWFAAPTRDSAEFNRQERAQCVSDMNRARMAALERGRYVEPPPPASCTQTPEREHWRTDILLIAAVLAVGAAVVVAIPPRHR